MTTGFAIVDFHVVLISCNLSCRLFNLSSIMVQYLSKVSLNFHQHNIKLDDTIISTHVRFKKTLGNLFQYLTQPKYV